MSKLMMYSITKIHPDKREAIWGMFEPNILMPLCYLQKPKYVSQEDWEIIVRSIRFDLKQNSLEMEIE